MNYRHHPLLAVSSSHTHTHTHTAFAMLSTRLKPNPVSEYQSVRDVRMSETDTLRTSDRHEEINLEMDMWMIRNRLAATAAGFIAHLTLSLSRSDTLARGQPDGCYHFLSWTMRINRFCFTTLKTKCYTIFIGFFLSWVFHYAIPIVSDYTIIQILGSNFLN